MTTSSFKALTRTRAPKFGNFIVEFATPGIGHIARSAGCDFVLFDMEHSGFHFETVKSVIRYFEAADLPAIVRVPSKDYHHIARAMDMGVEALMLPMVNDAREVRAILDAMKYHPLGMRGVGLQVAHDRYRPGPVDEKFATANERSAFVCLIETAAGIENIDEIAAIDGVDCLWVGHFDLSVSLGIPGRFQDPAFVAAIDRVTKAAARNNKSLGRLVATVESGIELNAQGFDFICYSGDAWLLQAALADGIARLRAGTAGKGRKA